MFWFFFYLCNCPAASSHRTHSESVAPLPAAVVHGVPPVQPDPKPVLLVLGLPVGHMV